MRFERQRFLLAADVLATAVAIVLPWSTSATGILLTLWLLSLLPTLDLKSLRWAIALPAGGLPVLLVVLGLAGLLWADVPFAELLNGIDSFFRLLTIPLFFIQFRNSGRELWVIFGFVCSCSLLLLLSILFFVRPELRWHWSIAPGIPVNEYIAQSTEFTLCAFGLFYGGWDRLKAGRYLTAMALSLLAAAFLLDIFFIVTGRTTLVVIPVLMALFGLRYFGWRGLGAAVVAAIILAAVVWSTSPYVRMRIANIWLEIQAADTAMTSTGERLSYWTKSIDFVASAPLIGHGTGSINKMFRGAVSYENEIAAESTANPHNQVFAIAIQLGLVGVVLLFAMWLSHLCLFWRPGLVAWLGLVIVVQNIVGSMFNSHLFDFIEGWLYTVGVGVLGGAVLRKRRHSGDAGTRSS